MLLIHGRYFFKPKLVAYRDDYCLTCAAPTRALQYRSFDVIHIYYIPVIPLFFWRHWKCPRCGKAPHENPRTSLTWKWGAAIIFGLLALMMWLMPSSTGKGDEIWFWGMRLGFTVALIASLWWIKKSAPEVDLREELRKLTPGQEIACPFCAGPFVPKDAHWMCTGCGIERLTVGS